MILSIRAKVFILCLFVMLLSVGSISTAYFLMTKQDKQRESRQRIQIAFDFVLNDFFDQLHTYPNRFEEFLKQDNTLRRAVYTYNQNPRKARSTLYVTGHLIRVVNELKKFANVISVNKLCLYTADKRLLAMYRYHDGREEMGAHAISASISDSYLSLVDRDKQAQILYGSKPIPDVSLPDGFSAHYDSEIPDAISAELFTEGRRVVLRILAPVYYLKKQVGLLSGEIFYTQSMIEQYALLSKTAVNLFGQTQLSVGTLPQQTHLMTQSLTQIVDCEDIQLGNREISLSSVTFNNQSYYQGQCALRNKQDAIGAITVSLSKKAEEQEIRKILTTVLWIAGIAIALAFGLAVAFSRRTIRFIHELTVSTSTIAEGKLDQDIDISGTDELGTLARSFASMRDAIRKQIVKLETENTERKKTEKALRESEEKMRLIIESSPMGIRIAQNGKFVYVNSAFVKMFAYDGPDDIVGRPIEDLYAHEAREMIRRRGRDRSADKEVPSSYEVKGLKKNGEAFDVAVWITIIDYEGEPATLAFTTDIGEAKSLRLKLQRAEKMEAVGTLAGGVAHDLNNILSGLVSYPDLLLMDLEGDSPFRQVIHTIKDSGEKAAAIVQDMLTLARRGVAVTEVTNLNDIALAYMESPEQQKLKVFHPSAEFRISLAPDLLNIVGSPVHISKTIMNLISNATESLRGGGVVSILTRNEYVDKPVKGYDDITEGDYVVLSVADTGIGIALQDLEKIFEPFYTKKVMGISGTGLGMAVVWGTVKDHDGYIHVKSKEEKGTTFKLYFPTTRKEMQKEQARSIGHYLGNGEKILVVDDVKQQRDIAKVLLKRLGYSVDTVASGEKAIEYMKHNTADLLLLDMIMDPGIDGLDTYKGILEMHPAQKAIIASGYSETERVKEAQKLGAGPYLKKPYTLEKIGLAVKAEIHKQ